MSEPCRVITEEQYRDYIRSKEQLKEANEVIKDYDGFAAELTSDGKVVCKYANSAHLYLEKWGVK